jgi:PmbA protein
MRLEALRKHVGCAGRPGAPVEDGAIRHPLIETMISGNLQDLLLQIAAVSRESVNFGSGRFPYLAACGVTISSKD